jgi:Mg2+ and Co2+ transporter CorA
VSWTAGSPRSLRAVTDLLYGLDAADRERVAALRAEGRFFWLDVSLSETSREDLVDALGIPERVLGALWRSRDGFSSRAFHADGESLVFALRCYVELEPEREQDEYRLRPIEVHVLLTSDYLLTLHHERVSLSAVLAPDLPPGRSKQYVAYSVLDAMFATTSDALGSRGLASEPGSPRSRDPSAEPSTAPPCPRLFARSG